MSTARHQLAGAPGTGTTIDNMSSRVKAWSRVNYSSGVPSLMTNMNVSGIVDTALGQLTINLSAPMASVNYSFFAVQNSFSVFSLMGPHTATAYTVNFYTTAFADPSAYASTNAFGDLA